MSKINKITLSNFKFFGKEDSINLDGKHLLLYGENGSGKSSIYWGLYTLLESAMKNSSDVKKYFEPIGHNAESLVNINAPLMSDIRSHIEHANSYIIIETDNAYKYSLSLLNNNVCGNTTVQESRKASDFINYQSIFKFQEFRNSETPDLYEIFVHSILPYVNFSSISLKGENLSNAGEMWKSYTEGPGTTINKKGDTIQVYKNSAAYTQFETFDKHFDSEIKKLLDFITPSANKYVEKLGYNINFELNYKKATFIKRDKTYDYTPFAIELVIKKYNGNSVDIERPQTFLNEAKMSAIATAIRLSVIDFRINSIAEDALKVLILDDLMISLDMSNREKLTGLLLTEYSSKYQLIFMTHDINLYTFLKKKINKNSWITKEMYIGDENGRTKEYPIIIDGECEPIEKAWKYYLAKDYVASGVFIRKAIEELITYLEPKELYLKPDGGFVSLQILWDKLISFYSNNKNVITPDIIQLFNDSKLLVLNPSAHFQRLASPVYRNELLSAFSLYDELSKLPKIEKKLVIPKGAIAEFDFSQKNYSCRFEFDNDLIIIAGDNLISVMPKCKNIYWVYNGTDYYDFETRAQNLNHPLKSATPKLNKFIEGITQKIPLGITEEQFLENCKINGVTMNEYFGGVKISSLIIASTKA